jgi:hypothetical protein
MLPTPPAARPSRLTTTLLLAAAVVLTGVAALWQLWEQDIFWQLRAGGEVVHTHALPTRDEWSYTARGLPWMNVQWLATVLLWAVHALGGVTALVMARGVLVTLLAAVLLSLSAPFRSGARLAAGLAVMPLVLFASAYRLQLRPDLMVCVVYAGLLSLWISEATPTAKRVGSFLLIVLAANLHVGTTPFLVATALAFLLVERRSFATELPWALAFAAAFLVTPYHVEALRFVTRHLFYESHNVVPNPEYRPMTWAWFDVPHHGLPMVGWAILTLASWTALLFGERLRVVLPPGYRNRRVTALVLFALTLLALRRARAVPYLAIYEAPVAIALVLAHRPRARLLAATGVWLIAVPVHLAFFPWSYGLGLRPFMFPVEAVTFLKAHGGQPNLLHMQADGNYLLWAAPEFPTFVDPRETMFSDVEPVYLKMFNEPAVMRDALTRWDIRSAVLRSDLFLRPWIPNELRREALFPPSEWALAYFDRWTVVIMKRAPGEKELPAGEFHLLIPERAPWAYLDSAERTPALDAQFEAEIDRCLRNNPLTLHCQTARASVLRRAGKLTEARELLEEGLRQPPVNAFTVAELKRVLEQLGDAAGVQRVEALLPPAPQSGR